MIDNEFLMDDKIKKRLRLENSVIPENIHQIIVETGNKLPTRKRSRRGVKYLATALLIIIFGLTTVGMTNPSYARNIPLIGSVFKALDSVLYSKYNSYATDLNITKESNGYKMTLNTVAYDGIYLTIAYTVKSDCVFPFEPTGFTINYLINGKQMDQMNTSVISGKLSADKKTYKGVAETILNSSDATELAGHAGRSNKFNLDINIVKMYFSKMFGNITTYKTINGPWSFSTSITNQKSKGKICEQVINVNLDSIEKGMKLNKLVLTPLNTILQGTNSNDPWKYNYIVYDDKGRVFPMKNNAGGDNLSFQMSFKGIYSDTKTLTFIPYMYKKRVVHTPKLISNDLNIKGKTNISLGKHGNLIVNKVEVVNGETKLYYKCKLGYIVAPMVIEDKDTGEQINLKDINKSSENEDAYVVTFNGAIGNKKYIVKHNDYDDTIINSPKLLSNDLNIKGETNISLGRHGDLKITKVEILNGKTKLHYKCKFGSLVSPVAIEDKETHKIIYAKLMSKYQEESAEYIVSFDKALSDKQYIVLYNNIDQDVTIFDDSKFTVNIKK